MANNILSNAERKHFDSIPQNISDADLAQFFTLAPVDREHIRNVNRTGPENLHLAAHICCLRWLGFSPTNVGQLPELAAHALCRQLGLKARKVVKLAPSTISLHTRLARKHLGWQKYRSAGMDAELTGWLQPHVAKHDQGRRLLELALEHLRAEHIDRPSTWRIEKLVEDARQELRDALAENIRLSPRRLVMVDVMLRSKAGRNSQLDDLKETPLRSSPSQIKKVLTRLFRIQRFELDDPKVGLGKINPNRRRYYANVVRPASAWHVARRPAPQRRLLLLCFMDQRQRELYDHLVRMHNEYLNTVMRHAKRDCEQGIVDQSGAVREVMRVTDDVFGCVCDEQIADVDLRPQIVRQHPISQLLVLRQKVQEILSPKQFEPLTFVLRSLGQLRKFSAFMLRIVPFTGDPGAKALLEAIAFMRKVYDAGAPFENAPTAFVERTQWESLVILDSKKRLIDRRAYEFSLHFAIAQALEHGRLWISGSDNYANYREQWIDDKAWPEERKQFLRPLRTRPALTEPGRWLNDMRDELHAKMKEANAVWPSLKDEVSISADGTLHLAKLQAAEHPPGTAALAAEIARRFPRVDVPRVVFEGLHWTKADLALERLDGESGTSNLMRKVTVLLAEGLNIGPDNMARCVDGISYRELRGTYDAFFREETLNQTLAVLVNYYHHQIALSRVWGDGTHSSSDGKLLAVPVRTIAAQYHPESLARSGRAVNLYTTRLDKGVPIAGKLLYNISHEPFSWIDHLVHNHTDVHPVYHATDTGGYTDAGWGCSYLLGLVFQPRLRHIQEMRLFRMQSSVSAFTNIRALFDERINETVIKDNWDDVCRVTASIERGHFPASRILARLGGPNRNDPLARAFVEIGRLRKSLYLLDFLTKIDLRHSVQRRLSHQESLHAMFRELFAANGGMLRLHDPDQQAIRMLCLYVLTTLIIIWNAAYMQAAVETLRKEGRVITDDMLSHILPVGLEHINRMGKYSLNLRPAEFKTSILRLQPRTVDDIMREMSMPGRSSRKART